MIFERKVFYPTLMEASSAVKALGITSVKQYQKMYRLDPLLPSSPKQVYEQEWQSWLNLFGRSSVSFYPSLAEASKAAIALGIDTCASYKAKRHLDPRLPSEPESTYKNEWNCWPLFLGKNPKEFYATLAEASAATIALGITTIKAYQKNRHLDPKLPSNPNAIYKDDWINWPSFFGRSPKKFYLTLEEASSAAKKLGITSSKLYEKYRHLDPLLPAAPDQKYQNEWKNWESFLGNPVKDFYPTLEEASNAAIALGITSISEYQKIRHLDPRLPSSPDATYHKEWKNWFLFLKKSRKKLYQTLEEASAAAIALGITSSETYKERRKLDPKLPSTPHLKFKGSFLDWSQFLLPKRYTCLKDVKQAVKVIGIRDSVEYRKKRKIYTFLPAHPDRKFREEWIDWYDLCDIPKPYSYEEATALIAHERLKSKREYIDFIIQSGDKRLPRTPEKVYKNQWKNWYVYLGNKEPYLTKNIRYPYSLWAEIIQQFFKTARGGKSKESHLCRFVRHYIQERGMGESPQDFLTLENKDIKPFREWLSTNKSKLIAHKILISVNEFLDFVIREYLTSEDDKTGEVVRAKNAYNPFSNLSINHSLERKSQLNETDKFKLAYQYVQAARQWIIPKGAKTFSDLTHLQKFRSDWFDVDPEKVDINDPNCIVRDNNGKLQIWFPAYWIHTYTLMSVPARGRQIAYCDSGEADEMIPIISNSGSIKWEKNPSPLSGTTKNQGFIQYIDDGELGMYFTSNKTSSNGRGYGVPWIPDDLAYWIIQLRNWQKKYNPIFRPMPWLDCKRTWLNEMQRNAKGSNCFLFRDFGSEEPGHFSGRLASRLSAALYHTQPRELQLASLSKDETVLKHYTSKYTPHSMRVSLITAYLEEFRLPLTTIMKVAGHSSVVMTIYYCKLGAEDLRHRFTEGEKRAMQNKAYAAQRMIEQGRIDEIKNELIATTSDALNLISSDTPVGTYLFRDYGICPFGGQRCDDGGEFIQCSQIRSATPVGYLGSQNCIACRHFITGPAFMGGLLSLGNEISLASHLQYEKYSELEQQLKELNRQINAQDDAAYDLEREGAATNIGVRNDLELQKRKTFSEFESAAKKLDSIVCDYNKVCRHIKQCQALVNNETEKSIGDDSAPTTKLIIQSDHELEVAYEDASLFKQLSEVCENSEIYQCASSEMALAPRSQLLDKMALKNMVPLHMFSLDKKQQLVVGNQITRLMLDRLKCWTKVDALVDGRICLQDLSPNEQITKQELLSLASPKIGMGRLDNLEMDLL